jgi:hypothetical protein
MPVVKTKSRPSGVWLWLPANDPGQIRLLTAGRAALALLSLRLILRTILPLLSGGQASALPLFGVQAGMVLPVEEAKTA